LPHTAVLALVTWVFYLSKSARRIQGRLASAHVAV